jgi:hypothetical protein
VATGKVFENCIYDGFFKDGKEHGRGRQIFFSGNIYCGNLEENKANGFGLNIRVKHENLELYEGCYQDDQYSGFGIYVFGKPNRRGDQYQGEWQKGLRHGKGVYFYSSGEIYDGSYLNDRNHVKAKWYGKDD